ncbi:hypothetical protein DY000_02022589 [Brassica cretica]|uniref:Uncharacterized protein n=1 Tax=Brassica cretica TaxID=69181 RepID=A0ABQ7EBX2_BRACR|nr:hypothetical protein DY000_02022589 [Brassica cretica]
MNHLSFLCFVLVFIVSHDHDDVPRLVGHRKHVDQKLPAKPKGPHSPLQFSAQSIPQGPTTCFINSKTIIYGVMYGKDMASSITKCNGNHWESREDEIYHQWASMYAWYAAISKASSFGASCISVGYCWLFPSFFFTKWSLAAAVASKKSQ